MGSDVAKNKLVLWLVLLIGLNGCNLILKQEKGYLYHRRLQGSFVNSDSEPKRTSLFGGSKISFTKRPEIMDSDLLKRPAISPLEPSSFVPTGISAKEAEAKFPLRKPSLKKTRIAAEEEAKMRLYLIQTEEEKERLKLKETNLKQELERAKQSLSAMKEQKKGLDYYEVQKGDSLWSIAEKKEIYSNGFKWLEIYGANKDKIERPDFIYPGQVLLIPNHMGMKILSLDKNILNEQK